MNETHYVLYNQEYLCIHFILFISTFGHRSPQIHICFDTMSYMHRIFLQLPCSYKSFDGYATTFNGTNVSLMAREETHLNKFLFGRVVVKAMLRCWNPCILTASSQLCHWFPIVDFLQMAVDLGRLGR